MALSNNDIFVFLKHSVLGFTYQEQLFHFIAEKYNLKLSKDNENKLKEYLRLYCINMYKRWQKSNRTLQIFSRKNNTWLNKEFKIPEKYFSSNLFTEVPSTTNSNSVPSKRKAFSDVSDRHKRRLTENLREEYDSDTLLFAAKQKLQSEGSEDSAMMIDYLMKNPCEAKRIRAFCENKIQASLFSKEKSLAMFLSLNLSKFQYIHLRQTCIENGTNQWQSYYQIQKAKSDCYPPKNMIIINDTFALIKLQAILDLTVSRLLTICEDKLSLNTNLKLICKWGFDGASNQSIYKQKFTNGDLNSDNYIFMTSFVPIQLISDFEVVWINKTSSSTRYCRPIRFEFIHETTNVTITEYQRMEEEIKNLVPMQYKNITINYEMLCTMIDGKVCTALSNETSCATCSLCGAKPSEMNKIDKLLTKDIDKSMCNFGISNLHAKIRCMEFLLHVSYNLPFQK